MGILELTRTLVRIPSHEDATVAGDELEEWLDAETDAKVERDEVGNVIASRGSGDPSLALAGHHDVVPPDPSQVTADGFSVEERSGRLYGRGTADMKGPLAAAAHAFCDADPTGTLVFASFVGEEVGGVGARHAIENGFAPDAAIVVEGSTGYSAPGVTDVAIAHKGRRGHTITASGEAAHASEPAAGTNAIYRATDAVSVIRSLDPPTARVAGTDLTGSVVVTEIEGGSAMNVIPEHCTVTVDERTVPGDRAALEQVQEIDGIEWTVDQDLPPMRCSDDAFAAQVLEAAASEQPDPPNHVVKPHATDAGWLAEAGTACVICGAAEPGEAHSASESVSIEVLDRCRRIYQQAVEAWPP